MLRWKHLDLADRLDRVNDVMGVDLAMDLLMLDLVDLRFYCFLDYCCNGGISTDRGHSSPPERGWAYQVHVLWSYRHLRFGGCSVSPSLGPAFF